MATVAVGAHPPSRRAPALSVDRPMEVEHGARFTTSSSRRAIELLRIALGGIWAVNLLFIVYPAADYWATFSTLVQSSVGGSSGAGTISGLVLDDPLLFAWAVAGVTVYLAVAFLLGIGTKIACVIGAVFSAALFGLGLGSTFAFPGGTDVGPHPVYLAAYAALYLGDAGTSFAVNRHSVTDFSTKWLRRALRLASTVRRE